MRVIALIALLLMAACSSTPSSRPAVPSQTWTTPGPAGISPAPALATVPPPGAQPVDGGCGTTQALKGGTLPNWASGNAPAFLTYVVASPAIAVGYIFSNPLLAGADVNNKILWYVWTTREGPLTAVGHPLGSSVPTAAFTKAADSGPGEIYPTGPTVPAPGCWQFTLTWEGGGAHNRAQVNLLFG